MDTFTDRVAVVTGAASGMGLAMARRFAKEGMHVVLADVESGALDRAFQLVRGDGGDAIAVLTDVSSAADVDRLAERAVAAFGRVNVLCNNAGVVRPGAAWEQSLDDWTWVLGVNLWGVVHGIRAFIPRMLAQGDDCHVVNTASAGGLVSGGGTSSYAVSKFGVVALSEGLVDSLRSLPHARIGVSVLCPGGVATQIFHAERNRPAALGELGSVQPEAARRFAALGAGDRTDQVPPEFIADLVLDAIKANQFYILPMQPHFKDAIRARHAAIDQGLAHSPATGVPSDGPGGTEPRQQGRGG